MNAERVENMMVARGTRRDRVVKDAYEHVADGVVSKVRAQKACVLSHWGNRPWSEVWGSLRVCRPRVSTMAAVMAVSFAMKV
jgi:hypothetical protein